jgi:hypothetical protein
MEAANASIALLNHQMHDVTNAMHTAYARLTESESKPKGDGRGKTLHERLFDSSYSKPKPLTQEAAVKVDRFREWSMSIKDYVDLYVPGLTDAMKEIEERKTEISLIDAYDMTSKEHDDVIYRILLEGTSEGSNARIIIRQTLGKCGLEAWRQLHHQYDPMTAERGVEGIHDLYSPPTAKNAGDVMATLMTWEGKLDRYARKTNQSVESFMNDGFRRSVLMIRI